MRRVLAAVSVVLASVVLGSVVLGSVVVGVAPAAATVPAAAAPAAGQAPPPFVGVVAPLSAAQRSAMTGVVWHPGCPVALSSLRSLTLSYWGYDDEPHLGTLVVHRDAAAAMVRVFRRLYEARFHIERMEPAEVVGGDDDELGRRNITSGFNCRRVSGSSRWSQHAYGRAVDVNPLVNPWLRADGTASLAESAPFADRGSLVWVPGVIRPGDAAVRAFRSVGWRWGGDWRTSKDLQHFSANGR